MSIEPMGLGFPSGIKMAFYVVPALPAVVGLVLIAVGVWVVVKFKNKD